MSFIFHTEDNAWLCYNVKQHGTELIVNHPIVKKVNMLEVNGLIFISYGYRRANIYKKELLHLLKDLPEVTYQELKSTYRIDLEQTAQNFNFLEIDNYYLFKHEHMIKVIYKNEVAGINGNQHFVLSSVVESLLDN